MNFPSYRPKPLSLLGRLVGGGQGPEVNAAVGESEGMRGLEPDTSDLLISLDGLSMQGEVPVQSGPVESEPSPRGHQEKMDKDAGALDQGLIISLDDLLDEPEPLHQDAAPSGAEGKTETGRLSETPPELFIFEPEPEIPPPEKTSADKGGAGPKATAAGAPQPEKDFWAAEALAQRVGDFEPELLELELESPEFTLEMEEPDKKTS